MSAELPMASGQDSDDPVGTPYPNTARIWNYQLGGKDNFAVDREASKAANAMVRGMGVPAGADTALESRHLLQRMVDYMLGQGVRQFLDLGSGLPNMANTHQIAHRAAAEARIVYVDIDPLVSTYAADLRAGPNVVMLRADLREPEQVLSDTRVGDLLDFGQPVGIMFMCVLHCLWDREDPWGVVGQFRDAVAPGSYLALSHMTGEAHPEAADRLFRITQELHWNTPLISRDRADIARFFDGFTLVEPGLVTPAHWRPDLDSPLRNRQDADDDGEPRAQADRARAARRRSRRRVAPVRGWHQGRALNRGTGVPKHRRVPGVEHVTETVSFARDIRPLFTDMDIEHMRMTGVALDDIAYMSVPSHAERVYQKLSSKQMPPRYSGESPWPDANIQLFRDWIDGGFQP